MTDWPLNSAEPSLSLNSAAPNPAADRTARRQVAAWLLLCCALLFAMIVMGGITRLTHSGLSIVEWQPLIGTLPPLDQAQWEEVFRKYQQTPEYQQVNQGMSLAGFKAIFWWEYAHRLLGRLIGLVFLLPFVYFLLRKKIDKAWVPKLAGIFLLGALQGPLGWYMVKSGLVDDPRVSQYLLTAHLGWAFLIYAAIFWTALSVLYPKAAVAATDRQRPLRRFSWVITGLIFLMILLGGLVAGIRAGFAYNTFPLMNGHWIPSELFMLQPWYLNFFNNMATVQFNHRLIAWVLFLLVPLFLFWFISRWSALTPRARLACYLLLAMLLAQITLGITTLVHVVPLPLAAAHQAGAVLLFSCALLVNQALLPESPAASTRR